MTTTNVSATFTQPSWGGWELHRDTLVLDYTVHGRWDYEVDLETCLDAAQMLNWIFHLRGKQWANPEVFEGLLTAFEDILKPRRNLCPGNKNQTITPAQVREMVENWF